MNPVLVEVRRGGMLESAHRGALHVVDADGAVLLSIGDVDRPVFPRSAIKLLQALPLVASGAAEALGLVDEELALACASHSGEPAHARTAAAMLAKAGVGPEVLECGVQWPNDAIGRALAAAGEAATALHNNCSGKHSGFVCLGCALMGGPGQGADLPGFVKGYRKREHPVMREVAAALQAATGCDLAKAPVGTDGCSIPTFGIPLARIAAGFARVATGVGLGADHARAAQRLRRAVAAAPFMVAGSGRFDTRVMERLGERVCCKVGAEGVYAAALPARGLGVAIKIDDGATRASEVVMASVIGALVDLDPDEQAFVDALANPVLRNWNGIEVGALRPSVDLLRLLPAGPIAR